MDRDDLAMKATLRDSSGSSGGDGQAGPSGGRIGRFVVLDMLGQGAMGIVFVGYDPDLHRKVAIKLLRPDSGDRSPSVHATERMLREARAMARLSHPNVLQVYEVGTIGEQIFIATELAAGGTLRQWVDQSRPWRATLDRFLQAARGLDAAHRAGLVHRDFKPENVLLTGDDRVRVADFGLVGWHGDAPPADDEPDGSRPDAVSLTRTGTLVGTPAYMAPEQHARGDVGPAADQFALCVSLWEGLYGVRPFSGDSSSELARRVNAGAIDEPPADRGVPAWLRDTVRRGLQPRPEDRWPSMAALITALEADPSARRASGGRRVGMVVGAAALAGIATFVLSRSAGVRDTRCSGMDAPLAAVWSPVRSAAVRDAFVASGRGHAEATHARVAGMLDGYARDWVHARVEVCEATHVRGVQSPALLDLRMACLDRRLAEVGVLVDVFATRASAEVVDRAATAANRLSSLDRCNDIEALQAAVPPPDDATTRAQVDELRMRIARAKALSDAGQFRDALPLARSAAVDAEQLGYPPVLAEALVRRAALETVDGDADAADATLEAALIAAAEGGDDTTIAQIWIERLFVIGVLGPRTEEALRLRSAAQAAVRRAGGTTLLEAQLAHNIGNLLITAGRNREAVTYLERAIAGKEETYGTGHLHTATSLNSLGVAWNELGDYDQASRTLRRAVEVWEAALGPEHPDVGSGLLNLADSLRLQGRLDDALAAHERGLRILEATHGPRHPEVATARDNLAIVLRAMGRLDEAWRHQEAALAIRVETLGPDHYDVGLSLLNLGITFIDLGRPEDALAAEQRAIAIYENTVGPDNLDLAHPLTTAAEALLLLGRHEESIASSERALRIRRASEGDPAALAATQFMLARALWERGRDRARALELAREARVVFAAAGDSWAVDVTRADAWLAERTR